MKFWDSSAIVPLLIDEKLSQQTLTQLRATPEMIVWWATPIECISALSRKERQSLLSMNAMTKALDRLQILEIAWIEIEPNEKIRQLAKRILRVHSLRAADSLQLAAALIASEQEPSTLEFICYDDQLSTAAKREGFIVSS